jgi:hypothetical protein
VDDSICSSDDDKSDGGHDYNDSNDSDMKGNTNDTAKLQEIIDDVEHNKYSFTLAQEEKLTRLSCAAVAITSDEVAKMYVIIF